METRTSQAQITTPDGAMPVYIAEPTAAGKYPAVIVVMEAFGLNQNIEEIARRIAGEGYVAVAPDVYYRWPDNKARYDELPKAIGLMQKLDDAKIVADMRATLDFLGKKPNVNAAKVGITGFCMGGRISFLVAAELADRIAACAPFYGGGIAGLLPKAEKIKAPLHLFFGEKDAFIPQDQVKAIDAKLRELKKSYALDNYAGADHGFFCNERVSYNEKAASDAWTKLKAFFRANLG
jgi:carboxymethylenebutenolidase